MQNEMKQKVPLTFTDRLRAIFSKPLQSIGISLHSMGINPNTLTLLGLLGTALGAFAVARGNLLLGGIIILAMGPFDALDGAVARAGGVVTEFGAFLDSVMDRYIELFIYGGLLWYFMHDQNYMGGIITFLAAGGSVLVSYVRARAQSLGFEAKVGILTRVERLVVIAPTIILNIPLVGVAIVASLANFTAFQRILYVKRQMELTE